MSSVHFDPVSNNPLIPKDEKKKTESKVKSDTHKYIKKQPVANRMTKPVVKVDKEPPAAKITEVALPELQLDKEYEKIPGYRRNISHEEASALLEDQKAGTYLIRSHDDHLMISYKGFDDVIHHSPIKNEPEKKYSFGNQSYNDLPTLLKSWHPLFSKPLLKTASKHSYYSQPVNVRIDPNEFTIGMNNTQFVKQVFPSVPHLINYSTTDLIHSGINELKQNYEKWAMVSQNFEECEPGPMKDHLEHRLKQIEKEIDVQKENLKDFSLILNEIHLNDELAPYLFVNGIELYASDIDPAPYLSGSARLDEISAEKLKQSILVNIDIEKRTRPIPDEQTAPKMEKASPLKKRGLQQQAALFAATRQGVEWAKTQTALTKFGKSVNLVHKLMSAENPTEIAVFHKEGAKKEPSAGIMEEIVWNIANILEVDEFFTPTKPSKIESAAGERYEGSAQLPLYGKLLHQLKVEGKSELNISREELIKSTIVSIVFGMFDAHANNIMLTDDNKIRFFDNTRSLAHSTKALERNQILFPYRCAIFDFKDPYEPLSYPDQEFLQKFTAELSEKMKTLEKYMESSQFKKMSGKLPPGWLDPIHALDAMKERLTAISRSGEVINLSDLVMQVFPYYKFFAGVALMTTLRKILADPDLKDEIDIQRKLLSKVAFYSLEKMTGIANALGVRLKDIKDVSEQKNLDFRDFIDTLKDYPNSLKLLTRDQKYKIAEENCKTGLAISYESHVDYKDMSKQNCRNIPCKNIIYSLNAAKAPIYKPAEIGNPKLFEKTCHPYYHFVYDIVTKSNGETYPQIMLHRMEPDGKMHTYEIDYLSKIGKICIPELNINDIAPEELVKRLAPPFFSAKIISNTQIRNFAMKQTPPSFILWSEIETGKLVCTTYSNGEVDHLYINRDKKDPYKFHNPYNSQIIDLAQFGEFMLQDYNIMKEIYPSELKI